jgi:hypothetical protein
MVTGEVEARDRAMSSRAERGIRGGGKSVNAGTLSAENLSWSCPRGARPVDDESHLSRRRDPEYLEIAKALPHLPSLPPREGTHA